MLAAAVVAPIGEEAFFRGFALTAWWRDLGPRSALIRSALFFAVVHILNIEVAPDQAGTGLAQALLAFLVILPLGVVLGLAVPAAGHGGGHHRAHHLQRDPAGAGGDRGHERRLAVRLVRAAGAFPGCPQSPREVEADRLARAPSVACVSHPGPEGGGIGGLRHSGLGAPIGTRRPSTRPASRRSPWTIGSAHRSVRELPQSERPRERLERRGAAGLSAPELMALVWGSGTRGRSAREVAEDALMRHDGVPGLAVASTGRAVPGAGYRARPGRTAGGRVRARATRAGGLAGRALDHPRARATSRIGSCRRWAASSARSCGWCCSRRATPCCPWSAVYQGNVSTALVRVGELFRDAVRRHAAGIIVVHNHPSGDPTPSPEDLHLTAEAVAAGRLLDVPVLDHLIIGHDAFVSLRDRGITFDRPGGRT